MTIPLINGSVQDFRDFLGYVIRIVTLQRGAEQMAGEGGDVGEVCWTLWLDPGTHTGLGVVVYYVPPKTGAAAATEKVSLDWWERALDLGGLRAPREGAGPVTPAGRLSETLDATGRIVLATHAEFLSGDERQIVRDAVARVRMLGHVWTKSMHWDADPPDDPAEVWCGLGGAMVGCEQFVNLRAERGPDYLSPVRVTAAFGYALDDEFGLDLRYQSSADMKHTFPPGVLAQMGVSKPGPDHVRDALGHALLAVRKNG